MYSRLLLVGQHDSSHLRQSLILVPSTEVVYYRYMYQFRCRMDSCTFEFSRGAVQRWKCAVPSSSKHFTAKQCYRPTTIRKRHLQEKKEKKTKRTNPDLGLRQSWRSASPYLALPKGLLAEHHPSRLAVSASMHSRELIR